MSRQVHEVVGKQFQGAELDDDDLRQLGFDISTNRRPQGSPANATALTSGAELEWEAGFFNALVDM
jgi:hypothetical protein